MKSVMVATDFSERSDRALRRAMLLARQFGAGMTLVHVVDDDQPQRIQRAEEAAATTILNEYAQTLQREDGVRCDIRVVEGIPFEGIARAAEDLEADVVVIGPHRRRALRDVFVGTTAERTIRASRRPVLMANGVPAASYRHALAAVDLSRCSADALRATRHLGLQQSMAISVLHVVDAAGAGFLTGATVPDDSMKDYLAEEEARGARELDAFLADVPFDPVARFAKRSDSSAANAIIETAREVQADLLVVGTHGRTGIARMFLGSVAQEVLGTVRTDVLAIPPESTSRL